MFLHMMSVGSVAGVTCSEGYASKRMGCWEARKERRERNVTNPVEDCDVACCTLRASSSTELTCML